MIGRRRETQELLRAYESEHSEFVALYGRRRVGKTFLVNEVFNYRFSFHTAGIENGSKREQLQAFREALKRQGHSACPRLMTWIGAFAELETLLESLPKGKKIVFLDELPWFDTACSGFLGAFELFWNAWATSRKDILLIICGSATTWILQKILRARGGLHNRVTVQLPIVPFTLRECEEYADYKRLGFNRRQVLECYMALGGVAYYWSLLREGLSAAQNFDRLFFDDSDEMRNEFERLFASLFKMERRHVEIVRLLGMKKVSMTRGEIVRMLGERSNGDISTCLDELVDCGFLRRYNPIGRVKKGALYQLIDNFVLFYFQFLAHRKGNDPQYWTHHFNDPALNVWRGLSFERVCLWHVPQIKKALGISGIGADVYSWRGESDEDMVQIDMLIDRADNTVSVCEMKYAAEEYVLDKDEDARLRRRVEVFRKAVGGRKAVQVVMVTSYGLKRNKYSGNVQGEIVADDLFDGYGPKR